MASINVTTSRVNVTSGKNIRSNNANTDIVQFLDFEQLVRIIIPIIFSLIVVIGLVEHIMVIIAVICNRRMQNTTNILILSLAVADLCFIVFCVPFTATGYAMATWPFGDVWCKIMQFAQHVSAYASVYTLVLMSLDRYLAVVHPITSKSIRTKRNTLFMVCITWGVILLSNIPILFHFAHYEYDYFGEPRSACVNVRALHNEDLRQTFFVCFFVCGYVLPLCLICVMYGLLIRRLLYGGTAGGSRRKAKNNSKTRATKLVVVVVVIFALCWLPIQLIFIIQLFPSIEQNIIMVAAQMAANVLAYTNSCVNPILYAFLSQRFRQNFWQFIRFYFISKDELISTSK
jgi:allatostatin receptor